MQFPNASFNLPHTYRYIMPKTLHCFSSKYVVSDRKKEIYEKTHFNYNVHTLKIRIKQIF